MTIRLIHGECESVLLSLDADSIDSCVTDPPYGIRFMGKAWDGADIERRYRESNTKLTGRKRTGMAAAAGKYDRRNGANLAFQLWCEEWASHVFRVLKPGAHLVAFGSPRTYHRLTSALEDAGFEIRDSLAWIFGSGFPKSHNLEGEHEGWGTALKPAQEPIAFARKPLEGTVAQNVAKYGTGALNIEGCRVDVEVGDKKSAGGANAQMRGSRMFEGGLKTAGNNKDGLGRWPANVLHDGSDEVVQLFPAEAGAFAPVRGTEPTKDGFSGSTYNTMKGRQESLHTFRGDSGSAARFFYCAKASREDREDGLAHIEKRALLWSSGTQSPGTFQAEGTDRSARNNHPTVKPTELMRYLCRLITPPPRYRPRPVYGQRLNRPRRVPRRLQLHRHRARSAVVADCRSAHPRHLSIVRGSLRMNRSQQTGFAI